MWGGGGEARREQQEAWLLESTFGYWLSLQHGERGGMERKEPVDWLACLCSQSPGSWSWCKVRAPKGGTGRQQDHWHAERMVAGQCCWLFPLMRHCSCGKHRTLLGVAGLAVGSYEAPGCSTSCPSEGLLVSGSVEGREGGCTSREGLAFLPTVPPAGTQASPQSSGRTER